MFPLGGKTIHPNSWQAGEVKVESTCSFKMTDKANNNINNSSTACPRLFPICSEQSMTKNFLRSLIGLTQVVAIS